MKNQKKHQIMAKFVLKNRKVCVIIYLPKIVNKQTCKQTYIYANEQDNKQNKGKRIKMVNIKDAANYVIGLFYKNGLVCTSAVVQKILVISQMKYFFKYDEPLFNEQIIVKPACFSIDFVSKFYPINIFESSAISLQEELPSTVSPDENIVVDIDSNSQLSSYTYKIERPLLEQEKLVLGQAFSCFCKYTGVAIGTAMQKMSLHKRYKDNPGKNIDIEEQRQYVHAISASISDTDRNNAIINFILSN